MRPAHPDSAHIGAIVFSASSTFLDGGTTSAGPLPGWQSRVRTPPAPQNPIGHHGSYRHEQIAFQGSERPAPWKPNPSSRWTSHTLGSPRKYLLEYDRIATGRRRCRILEREWIIGARA